MSLDGVREAHDRYRRIAGWFIQLRLLLSEAANVLAVGPMPAC